MGDDYSGLVVFAGDRDQAGVRRSLLEAVQRFWPAPDYERVFSEEAADVGIAFGPPGRWIPVLPGRYYDDFWDDAEMIRIANELSLIAPVIRTTSDDSAAINIYLHRNGRQLDHIGNKKNLFTEFSDEERACARGNAEEWKDLLPAGKSAEQLRALWDRLLDDATRFVHYTEEFLELPEWSLWCGFFTFYDGIATHWSEHLAKDDLPPSGFEQLLFRWHRKP